MLCSPVWALKQRWRYKKSSVQQRLQSEQENAAVRARSLWVIFLLDALYEAGKGEDALHRLCKCGAQKKLKRSLTPTNNCMRSLSRSAGAGAECISRFLVFTCNHFIYQHRGSASIGIQTPSVICACFLVCEKETQPSCSSQRPWGKNKTLLHLLLKKQTCIFE